MTYQTARLTMIFSEANEHFCCFKPL